MQESNRVIQALQTNELAVCTGASSKEGKTHTTRNKKPYGGNLKPPYILSVAIAYTQIQESRANNKQVAY